MVRSLFETEICLRLKLFEISFWFSQICGIDHCISVLRISGRISVKIRTNTGTWQHWQANNRPLTWLSQFVKDKLPLSGWANFLVLFLVQRPAFPMETILVFVGRTASHLHHCRNHSFFLNLQHHLLLWCRGNIAQKHNWVAPGTGTRHVADVCSRLRRSTWITHSQGGGERTAIASRVSTCRQNGLAHERLRYPKPSFCGRFGLPKLKNNVRRPVSHHRRRRSTATIKLTSCHVACGRRRASPCARSTRFVQSSAATTRRLVPLSHGWWPCRLHWWLDVPRPYARPPSERGISYENMTCQVTTVSSVDSGMTSVDNEEKMSTSQVKFEREELAARNCSTAQHARAHPICRVPSRLVSDSAILFLNSFSEIFFPISPHSLETDLYVRY